MTIDHGMTESILRMSYSIRNIIIITAVLAVSAFAAIPVLETDDSDANPTSNYVGYHIQDEYLDYVVTVPDTGTGTGEVVVEGPRRECDFYIIPQMAYDGCYDYRVTEIGYQAFEGCGMLETVIIEENVRTIGGNAFASCPRLKEVDIMGPLQVIDSGAFMGDSALVDFVFPESVTKIGQDAFRNSALRNVTIPAGVTVVGEGAFRDCGSLESVVFVPRDPELYLMSTDVKSDAFRGCASLSRVDLGSVTDIGSHAFCECVSLRSITIPDTVVVVNSYAFARCPALETVTFSDNCHVEMIPSGTFDSCTALRSINIPSVVTIIGNRAFYNTPSLRSVAIPSSLDTIGKNAFYGSGLLYIDLASAKFVDYCAFQNCQSLTEVVIPRTLTDLGMCAFNNCPSLSFVENNAELSKIQLSESHLLQNVPAVTTGECRSVYASIDGAGYYLHRTGEIYTLLYYIGPSGTVVLPDTIDGMDYTVSARAFADTPGITGFSVSGSHPRLSSIDGVLFSKDCGTLIAYPSGKPGTIITAALDDFGPEARLSTYTVPSSVTTVRELAFYGSDLDLLYFANPSFDTSHLEKRSLFVSGGDPSRCIYLEGLSLVSVPEDSTGSDTACVNCVRYIYEFNYANGTPGGGSLEGSARLRFRLGCDIVVTGAPSEYSFGSWLPELPPTASFGDVRTFTAKIYSDYYFDFDANGGSGAMERTGLAYGTPEKLPSNRFTRPYHDFAGWNTEADGSGTSYSDLQELSGLSLDPGSATKLYAQWVLTEYSVSYHFGGGTNDPSNPVVYTFETPDIALADASKFGYDFGGWYTEEDCAGEAVKEIHEGSSGDIDLYAKWIPLTFTVSFNTDGGHADPDSKHVSNGDEYGTLAEATKTGHRFIGWFTEPDGGTEVSEDDLVLIDGDITLYAHWIVNWYTVVLEEDGGTPIEPEVIVVKYGTPYGELPRTSRTGYTFGGWFIAGGDGEEITAETLLSCDRDHTLLARWIGDKHTITFHTNGGSEEGTEPKTVSFGSRYGELPLTHKAGFVFLGWYTERSVGRPVSPEDIVSIMGDQDLYAGWRANTYVVAFDGNGCTSGSMDHQSFIYNDIEIPLTPCMFQKTGYTFSGWSTTPDGEPELEDGYPVRNLLESGSITLYAVWTANRYLVIFGGNCADSGSMSGVYMTYDKPATLPANEFRKKGLAFAGWAREDGEVMYAVFRDREIVVNLTSEPDADFTLYAVWELRTATVAVLLDGTAVTGRNVELRNEEYGDITAGETTSGRYFATSLDGPHYDIFVDSVNVGSMDITRSGNDAYVHYHTVSFDADGTAEIPPQVVLNGEKIEEPPSPSKDGYIFRGWQQFGCDFDFDTPITVTTRLTAGWDPVHCTIIYVTDGGVNPPSNPGGFDAASPYIALEEAERTGYTFGGWYTDRECTGEPVTFLPEGSVGDIVLYAKWIPESILIVYDANGGTVTPAIQHVDYGGTYGRLATPVRTGYTFLGWFTAAEGGERIYLHTIVSDDSDHALFAHWEIESYTVAFDCNGGPPVSPAEGHVAYGSAYGGLPSPVWAGHTFDGWFTSADGGNMVTSDTVVADTGDRTIYAHWTVCRYTVVYDAASGTDPVPASKQVSYGSVYGGLAITTRAGYTFSGWYTDPDEGVRISPGTFVTFTGDTVLYAHWVPVTYTVVFDGCGSTSGKMLPATMACGGEAEALPSNMYARTGHVFSGWSLYPGGPAAYGDRAVVSNLAESGSVTLYAVWTAETCTVTFDPCGGSRTDPDSIRAVYGSTFGDLPETSRAGYGFEGWFTDASGGSMIVSGSIVDVTEDTVLYAHWSAGNYGYTVVYWDLSGNEIAPATYGTAPFDTVIPALKKDIPGYICREAPAVIQISALPKANLYQYIYVPMTYDVVYLVNGDPVGEEHYITSSEVAVRGSYERAGYDSGEWTSEQVSPDGGRFRMPADTVFFSTVSVPKTVTVRFDANGGSGTMEDIQYTYSDAGFELPGTSFDAPEGKTWLGWSRSESGAAIEGRALIDGDTVLYAVWGDDTITVSFDANGGDGRMDDIEFVRGNTDTAIRSTFSRDHHLFTGWNTAADGSGTYYADGTSVGSMPTSCTLYAQWEIEMFDVVYEVDGAAVWTERHPYGGEAAVREQYEMSGYYVTPWTGADSCDGMFTVTGNTVLSATSSPRSFTYTVYYWNNDGTEIVAPLVSEALYGTIVDAPVVEIDGYVYTGPTRQISIGDDEDGNWNAYVYTTMTYSVTYHTGGGSVSGNPDTYTVESGDIILKAASRDGYVFAGWFADEDYRDPVTMIPSGSTRDMELYAAWAVRPVAEGRILNFSAGEGSDCAWVAIDETARTYISSVDVRFGNGGSVSFPISVLAKAGTVTMTVVDPSTLPEDVRSRVGDSPVFSLSSSFGSSFGEMVTVTVPFSGKIVEGQTVTAYWIKDDGTLEEYAAVYSDGMVSFQTDHFSLWTVKAGDIPAVPDTDGDGSSDDSAPVPDDKPDVHDTDGEPRSRNKGLVAAIAILFIIWGGVMIFAGMPNRR